MTQANPPQKKAEGKQRQQTCSMRSEQASIKPIGWKSGRPPRVPGRSSVPATSATGRKALGGCLDSRREPARR
eukprot:751908-Hanusia_phi.AAC.1